MLRTLVNLSNGDPVGQLSKIVGQQRGNANEIELGRIILNKPKLEAVTLST